MARKLRGTWGPCAVWKCGKGPGSTYIWCRGVGQRQAAWLGDHTQCIRDPHSAVEGWRGCGGAHGTCSLWPSATQKMDSPVVPD